MLCFPHLLNNKGAYIDRKAKFLVAYGLKEDDARADMERRIQEVEAYTPRENARKVYEAYAASHASA